MAGFDPLHSARNKGATEYGGDNTGRYQSNANGHQLTPAEAATLIKTEGIRTAGLIEDLPTTDTHYDDMVAIRAETERRKGDWLLEDALKLAQG